MLGPFISVWSHDISKSSLHRLNLSMERTKLAPVGIRTSKAQRCHTRDTLIESGASHRYCIHKIIQPQALANVAWWPQPRHSDALILNLSLLPTANPHKCTMRCLPTPLGPFHHLCASRHASPFISLPASPQAHCTLEFPPTVPIPSYEDPHGGTPGTTCCMQGQRRQHPTPYKLLCEPIKPTVKTSEPLSLALCYLTLEFEALLARDID